MASKLKIKVNGLVHNVTASLDTPLLYVLHNELHLHGPRFGCGLAQCGACSVLLDGKEIRSCVTPVAAVSGKAITTLEGMGAMFASVARHDCLEPGCAASAAAGVDRRAGAALRLLPERNDDPGRRSAGDDEAPDRGADPHRDERPSLPLRHLSADPDGDPEGRCRDGEGWEVTMTEILNKEFSRTSFLKGGGALIVGFSMAGAGRRREGREGRRRSVRVASARTTTGSVDSWIAVHADNTVTLKSGKVELGQGTSTGLLMIAAEELDVAMSQMRCDDPRHERDARPGRHRRQPGHPDTAARRCAPRRRPRRSALLDLAATSLGVAKASLTRARTASSRAAASRSPTARCSATSSSTSGSRARRRRRPAQLGGDAEGRRRSGHEADQPVQARRHARHAADRHPGEGHRHVHLHAQHPGAGDAARPARAPARPGRATATAPRRRSSRSTRARSSTSRARRSSASRTSSASSRRRSTPRSRRRRSSR